MSDLWGLAVPKTRKFFVIFLFVLFFGLILGIVKHIFSADFIPVEFNKIYLFGEASRWRYVSHYPILQKCNSSLVNLILSGKSSYYVVLLSLIISSGVVFALIVMITSEQNILESINEYNRIEVEEQRKRELVQNQKILETQSFEQRISDLEEQYGKATTKVCLSIFSCDKLNIEKYFIVFGDTSVVFLKNMALQFKDILSYSLSDNKKIVQTAQTITTSKTGSVVGRGIVGGLVAGPAGAIIGGSTASKDSTTTFNSPITTHDYTIYITVNNLNNPMIELPIGNYENIARQISSLLEVIINNNNQLNYGK